MTKEQLAELRKLAKVATDGPWVSAGPSFDGSPVYDNKVVVENPDSNRHEYQICFSSRPQSPSDMEYIAAFNPVTAIALLDRIAELEKQAEALIDVTLISHFGGLANVSEGNALIAIRSMTLPFFNDVSHYTIQEQERLVNRAMIRTLKN